VPSLSVLVVEGENSQFPELMKSIERLHLPIQVVRSSTEALNVLVREAPALVLMDLLIDRKDAIDILNDIDAMNNKDGGTRVVFSERNEHYVEITALNSGADDFILKPVNHRVFASRLNAWLRHYAVRNRGNEGYIQRGDILLDEEKFAAFVKNVEVPLQRKEFEIVRLLISRPKRVFSRDEIKEQVWMNAQNVRNRTIDVHIRNLRGKLGEKYIKTYKGIGYSYDG